MKVADLRPLGFIPGPGVELLAKHVFVLAFKDLQEMMNKGQGNIDVIVRMIKALERQKSAIEQVKRISEAQAAK